MDGRIKYRGKEKKEANDFNGGFQKRNSKWPVT